MKKNIAIVVLVLVVGFSAWWIWRWESAPQELERAQIVDAASPDVRTPEDTITQDYPAVDLIKDNGVLRVEGDAPIVIDTERSYFSFEGYAVGKSHSGTFENMSARAIISEDGFLDGYINIDAASVKTDIASLDDHLRNEDFFNVEAYPEITFTGSLVEEGTRVVGTLQFLGVQKTLDLPVTTTPTSLEMDTVINVREFGLQYLGVDDEVRIRAGLYASSQQ